MKKRYRDNIQSYRKPNIDFIRSISNEDVCFDRFHIFGMKMHTVNIIHNVDINLPYSQTISNIHVFSTMKYDYFNAVAGYEHTIIH